jgi:hypothetical protein
VANLSQLIEAAVEAWRDGRSGAALDEAAGALVELDGLSVAIHKLERTPDGTAAVQVEVIGGDGETLAEARVKLREG